MPTPDPIAFTVFGLDVRWYGILMATAIAVGLLVIMLRAPRHHLQRDDLLDIVLAAIPCGIVGARLYYVGFNWELYAGSPLQIFNLRAGGLAIHGALIGGVAAALLVCHIKKISFFNCLDLAAPAIALGQAIGRWGNYFNSEAHGGPTDLPWAITVMGEKVHPTFLYESIWCLLLFFLLSAADRHRRFTGQIICLYGILYSIERFFVEGLRTDSLMIGPFRQAQVISIAIIILSAVLYAWLKKHRIQDETAE
ncbi:MAG: prolipoprotein diacylglyceryl transferase [Anaerovoracaceae bacterium]|jgi:phosphatidylglycerol:prolipoprotein diacylglycerol transferase